MPDAVVIASTLTAALFACVFLVGGHIHPLRILTRDPRSGISFGAGISTAYVFVHVMPELHAARTSFAEMASTPLPYEGMAIYYMALIGFLAFYGLDHLRRPVQETKSAAEAEWSFRVHIGGFAAYVGLATYLISNSDQKTIESIALYAVALAFHFLTVDHSLRVEYGNAYERFGRFLLAAMCVVGITAGILFPLPGSLTAVALAFLSGAIIVNSAISELSSQKSGHFGWFAAGALLYGLILIPLG